MWRGRVRASFLVFCAVCVTAWGLVVAGAGAATANATELVSVSTSGLGGNGASGYSVQDLDVSADGNIVVFDGYATDLVSSDANNTLDVFVRDRGAGTTQLADVDTSGHQGSSYSYDPAVSGDGRYVAFTSASALVPDDSNGATDIYVRDLLNQTTTRVSLANDGSQLGGYGSTSPDISADGRFVIFKSAAPELVNPIDGIAGYEGVFVRDTVLETTTRLDVGPTGDANNQGNGYRSTINGGISPNGRFVVFNSTGSNLVAGGTADLCNSSTSSCLNVFVRDRDPDQNGVYDENNAVTSLASVAEDGSQANDSSAGVSVSDLGDAVLWTNATNIGAPGDIVVRDHTGTTTIVGHNVSNNPVISSDGQIVAFDSWQPNGVPDDTNNSQDTYLVNRASNAIQRASVAPDGSQLPEGGVNPAISDTGRYVAFTSFSTAVLPAGSPSPVANVFLRDTTPPAGGAPTPTGTTIVVQPTDPETGTSPVTVTFSNVDAAGTTSVTSSASGPALPDGFQLGNPPIFYDVTTTATFTGPVTSCFAYNPAAFADTTGLQLWHFDSVTSAWQDVTTSNDTTNDVICGQTTSLSPFTVLSTTPASPAPQTIVFAGPGSGSVGGTASLSATGGLSENPVVFSVDPSSGSGVCNVSGPNGSTVNYTAAGACVLDANQASDANYTAAAQVQQTVTVGQGTQTIVFAGPGSGSVGGTASLSATGGLSENPVVFSVDASSGSGVCNVSGPNGSTVNYTAAGACVLDANQASDANYTAAAQVQQTVTVGQGTQTIAFTSTPPGAAGVGGSYTPTAAASSGLPVVVSIDASSGGSCSLTAGVVHFAHAGTCVINANQPGNSNYRTAPQVQQTITVKRNQTISFGSLGNRTLIQSPFTVNASASSGLTVTFSTTTPAVCTASGTNGHTITLLAPGTCTIKADQAGNATYNPAPSVNRSFTISKANQTISFGSLGNRRLAQSPFSVNASASSGLTVTFSTTTPAVCTASGTNGHTITLFARGTCTIKADQAGNATYNPAPSVNRSFRVT